MNIKRFFYSMVSALLTIVSIVICRWRKQRRRLVTVSPKSPGSRWPRGFLL